MRLLLSDRPSTPPKRVRPPTPVPTASTTFTTWRAHNNDALSTSAVDDPGLAVSPAEPWVTAFLTVAFDVDKGQIVESCVPEDVLTEAEKEAVCFSALPDSATIGSAHVDTVYSFRIRPLIRSDRLLLGHSLFRQAPDRLNPRGFFQKAVVVVSSAPCVTLPDVLLSILASKAFAEGEEALYRAVEDMTSWPDPRVQTDARVLRLPFVDEVISISLPHAFLRSFAAPHAVMHSPKRRFGDSPTSISRPSLVSVDDPAGVCTPPLVRKWPVCPPSPNSTAAPFHEIDIVRALAGVHDKIWVLWELVALGEPILVFAPTPSQASAAVLAIVGLLHPLPFTGDWRPYFCIQDPSYLPLTRSRDAKHHLRHGGVYGVTNCHIVDTLPFRHVLTLPGCEAAGKPFRPGLRTDYRGQLHRSRQLLAVLPSLSGAKARDAIFEKITRPFLGAFDKYLEPRWDGRAVTEEPYSSDPFGRALSLLPFGRADAPESGLFRSGRGRAAAFYERLVNGSVWKAWWGSAREAAEAECVRRHRIDVIEACVRGSVVARNTPTRADLRARLRRELDAADGGDAVLRDRLGGLLAAVGE